MGKIRASQQFVYLSVILPIDEMFQDNGYSIHLAAPVSCLLLSLKFIGIVLPVNHRVERFRPANCESG